MGLRLRIAAAGLAAATVTGTMALTAVVSAGPAQAAGPAYTTISKQSAADPGFAKFGSSYYVYATGSGDGILPIFRGSSLTKAFTRVDSAYPSAPAGLHALWAPHVVARDGRYFMFFTAAKGTGMIYAKGQPLRTVPAEQLVEELFTEIDKYYAAGKKVVADDDQAAEAARWLRETEDDTAL